MAAVLEQMRSQAAQDARKVADALEMAGAGTYMLVRFENPVSLRHVVTFSEARPSQQSLIAVLRQMLLQLEAYQMRDYWKQADQIDEDQEAQQARRGAILTPSNITGMPRAQRRAARFGRS
jgi:hypothetical protein